MNDPVLTWNPKKGLFVWINGDRDAAREIGLNWSTASRPGRSMHFTDEPYAALALWRDADPAARAQLARLQAEWEASRQKAWTGARWAMPGDVDLYPYQSAGVAYVLARRHALIGDQPGLGKTATAIVVANEMRARRVLVVCPAAVRLQWAREIRTWSTQSRPSIYIVGKSGDGVSPEADWTIISYDLARGVLRRPLEAIRWDYLVVDEGHYLKTPDALRTRAIFGGGAAQWRGLAKGVERVVALTGTPLPNRPRECYTLTRGLCHDAIDWMSEDRFRHRFNPSLQLGRTTREEVGRLPELRNRLRCNLLVRRLKKEVLTQLPAVHYELAYVDPDGEIRKALRAEAMLHIDPENLPGADMQIMGEVSTVRRQMGEAKVPRVIDHVGNLLDQDAGKIVLFAWHRSVMDALEAGLASRGVVRIDGSTSSVQRALRIRQFIEDDNTRVILGNLMSMGVGVDGLQQAASVAVFAEASWVPGDNMQAVDRLHRIGQSNGVQAQFLVAPGSFDERVLGSALKKERNTHKALDAGVAET